MMIVDRFFYRPINDWSGDNSLKFFEIIFVAAIRGDDNNLQADSQRVQAPGKKIVPQ